MNFPAIPAGNIYKNVSPPSITFEEFLRWIDRKEAEPSLLSSADDDTFARELRSQIRWLWELQGWDANPAGPGTVELIFLHFKVKDKLTGSKRWPAPEERLQYLGAIRRFVMTGQLIDPCKSSPRRSTF